MRHTPMERFGWEQLVRRAELSSTTKLIALTLATFANPGGGRVRPGERLVADCCGLKERAVREHMAVLRDKGLIECVIEGTRGRASVYQLTIPAADHDPLPMRLDPDGDLITERPVGRRGSRRPIKGTPVPVNNSTTGAPVPTNGAYDRRPGAGDSKDDRHPGAETPAPGRRNTGTRAHDDRHPGASHHTDHTNQPRPTVVALGGNLTSPGGHNDNTNHDHFAPGDETEWHPRDTEFANARRALDHSPRRETALTQARMELAAVGQPQPQFRDLIVLAARILAAEASGGEAA